MREFIVFRNTCAICSLTKFTFAISSADEVLVFRKKKLWNLAVRTLYAAGHGESGANLVLFVPRVFLGKVEQTPPPWTGAP